MQSFTNKSSLIEVKKRDIFFSVRSSVTDVCSVPCFPVTRRRTASERFSKHAQRATEASACVGWHAVTIFGNSEITVPFKARQREQTPARVLRRSFAGFRPFRTSFPRTPAGLFHFSPPSFLGRTESAALAFGEQLPGSIIAQRADAVVLIPRDVQSRVEWAWKGATKQKALRWSARVWIALFEELGPRRRF